MNEKTYGDIIEKYPELIEKDLKLIAREYNVYGRRIDILFEDEYKRKLIVELKVVPINDKHIGQVITYTGGFTDQDIRIMLVSPRVPFITRRALDYHGIGWKELKFEDIIHFLQEKKDFGLLQSCINETKEYVKVNKKEIIEIISFLSKVLNDNINYIAHYLTVKNKLKK